MEMDREFYVSMWENRKYVPPYVGPIMVGSKEPITTISDEDEKGDIDSVSYWDGKEWVTI